MIVPESTPRTPLKAPAKLPTTGESSQPAPPPSYAAVTAGAASAPQQQTGSAPPPPPGHLPSQHSEQAYYRYVENPHPRSVFWRFAKAWLVAVLIWVLLGAFIRSLVDASMYGGPGNWHTSQGGYSFDIPKGISLEDCVGYGNGGWHQSRSSNEAHTSAQVVIGGISYPYNVHKDFELPIDSKALFLLARGSLLSGRVDISTSDTLDSKVAAVNVTVRSYHQDMLEDTKVCRVTGGPDENGVGFFTPRWWGRRGYNQRVYFDIKVVLPASASSPLSVKKFATDLPNISHVVGDLAKLVKFVKLFLDGSNASIIGDSLDVQEGHFTTSNAAIKLNSLTSHEASFIKSSNGPVQGFFNATNSLEITTTNGFVKVNVNLTRTEDLDEAKLVIKTTNQQIDSSVDLNDATGSDSPKFGVETKTTNAPLLFTVKSLPVDGALTYSGRSSNGRADVKLPTTFEGNFHLSTSNAQVTLDAKSKVEDPAHRDRQRVVSTTSAARRYINGEVYWDHKHAKLGQATIETSNAPNTLHL